MENILGSGCFGVVVLGKVKGKEVAVKTIRSVHTQTDPLRAIVSEIKILQHLGLFENIVSLVGCKISRKSKGMAMYF